MKRIVLAGLVLAGMFFSSASRADSDDRPDAVPYRPTVSTPAELSAPGWLEVEFGGLFLRDRHADDGPSRRWSAPFALKYAFTEDWGVRVDGEALVHAADAGGMTTTGFGDTALIAKRRFALDTVSTFGVEVGAAFPTARRALQTGSGKTDYTATGIYSADAGDWHGDLNLGATRMGGRDPSGSRVQSLGACAISRRLDDRWTAEAEVSGTRQRHVAATSQVLGAIAFAVRRDVVVDVGVAHGLNRASPTWQAFTGVTFVAGRID